MRSDEPVLEPVREETDADLSEDGTQSGKAEERTAEKNGSGQTGIKGDTGKNGSGQTGIKGDTGKNGSGQTGTEEGTGKNESGQTGIVETTGKTGDDSRVTGNSEDAETGLNHEQSLTAQDSFPENETESGTPELLTVHVCGAVKKEGVYSLPAGSRIRDAIEAAGGFDKTADTSYLNLATKLEDSWQIRVPTSEEAQKLREIRDIGTAGEPAISAGDRTALEITSGTGSGGSAAAEPAGDTTEESGKAQKININTASAEELTKIPGVGDSKAQKIIEYREKNGRFESIEDIMNVTGIKENSFRKMREYITV